MPVRQQRSSRSTCQCFAAGQSKVLSCLTHSACLTPDRRALVSYHLFVGFDPVTVGWNYNANTTAKLQRLARELCRIIANEKLHSLFVSEIFELADGHNIGEGIGDSLCDIVNAGPGESQWKHFSFRHYICLYDNGTDFLHLEQPCLPCGLLSNLHREAQYIQVKLRQPSSGNAAQHVVRVMPTLHVVHNHNASSPKQGRLELSQKKTIAGNLMQGIASRIGGKDALTQLGDKDLHMVVYGGDFNCNKVMWHHILREHTAFANWRFDNLPRICESHPDALHGDTAVVFNADVVDTVSSYGKSFQGFSDAHDAVLVTIMCEVAKAPAPPPPHGLPSWASGSVQRVGQPTIETTTNMHSSHARQCDAAQLVRMSTVMQHDTKTLPVLNAASTFRLHRLLEKRKQIVDGQCSASFAEQEVDDAVSEPMDVAVALLNAGIREIIGDDAVQHERYVETSLNDVKSDARPGKDAEEVHITEAPAPSPRHGSASCASSSALRVEQPTIEITTNMHSSHARQCDAAQQVGLSTDMPQEVPQHDTTTHTSSAAWQVDDAVSQGKGTSALLDGGITQIIEDDAVQHEPYIATSLNDINSDARPGKDAQEEHKETGHQQEDVTLFGRHIGDTIEDDDEDNEDEDEDEDDEDEDNDSLATNAVYDRDDDNLWQAFLAAAAYAASAANEEQRQLAKAIQQLTQRFLHAADDERGSFVKWKWVENEQQYVKLLPPSSLAPAQKFQHLIQITRRRWENAIKHRRQIPHCSSSLTDGEREAELRRWKNDLDEWSTYPDWLRNSPAKDTRSAFEAYKIQLCGNKDLVHMLVQHPLHKSVNPVRWIKSFLRSQDHVYNSSLYRKAVAQSKRLSDDSSGERLKLKKAAYHLRDRFSEAKRLNAELRKDWWGTWNRWSTDQRQLWNLLESGELKRMVDEADRAHGSSFVAHKNRLPMRALMGLQLKHDGVTDSPTLPSPR